jgi:hypothetical protein
VLSRLKDTLLEAICFQVRNEDFAYSGMFAIPRTNLPKDYINAQSKPDDHIQENDRCVNMSNVIGCFGTLLFPFHAKKTFLYSFRSCRLAGERWSSLHTLKNDKEEAEYFRIAPEGLNQFDGNVLWEIRPDALLLQDRISRLGGLDRSLRYV